MQDWLAHRARTTPDREALVNASSSNAWTYATLEATVEEMAGRLSALGVTEGDHLAAVMETGVEEVCLIHASMRLGAVLVPLAPEFTPPELAERFDRADVDTVVCDETTESQVRGAAERVDPWLDVFTIDDTDWSDATPLVDADPAEFTSADWERSDTQLLLFTSGTTGQPKAVRLTMGNLLASAIASAFRLGVDPADRWLVPLSLHHMGGIAPILRSTIYGTTVIVRESFEPGGTVDDIREYDATGISLVPTMLRRMLSARGTLPGSLRFALVGGAPCPTELVERCRDFSVPICPTYGMTETASQVATARHTEAYDHPDTVGRPLLWTDVTVVDGAGTPVEPGETGELVVRGPTVTPGYYDDHATTGETMGAYGFHTGDVGRFDEDGRIYVLNRLDDRILTGGENVDPGEVVDALREYPGIDDAAVVGLNDPEWGERVAALVVPAAGASEEDEDDGDEEEQERIALDELEPFLRDRLAGFKLPRTVGVADELPRTVSGTVERDAVRERLVEGETVSIGREQPSARAAADAESVRAVARDEGEEAEESSEGAESESTEEAEPEADTEPERGDERPQSILDAGSDDEQPSLDREPAAAAESDADSARALLGAEDEERERRGGAALSPRARSRVEESNDRQPTGSDASEPDNGDSDDSGGDDETDDERSAGGDGSDAADADDESDDDTAATEDADAAE